MVVIKINVDKINTAPAEAVGTPEHAPSGTPAPQRASPGMLRLAQALSRAHVKYFHLFGVEAHGTVQQLMAVLEMCPEAKEYIRLYEDKREESLTV